MVSISREGGLRTVDEETPGPWQDLPPLATNDTSIDLSLRSADLGLSTYLHQSMRNKHNSNLFGCRPARIYFLVNVPK
jgi:hypothetical protein